MRHDTAVVVAPRDRHSPAPRILQAIFDNVPAGTPVLYADPGSRGRVRRQLNRMSATRGLHVFTLPPGTPGNAARNAALAHVTAKYVAFVENDTLVTGDWLTTLVAAAQRTGAAMVVPLLLQHEGDIQKVHAAGGEMRIVDDGGRRRLDTRPIDCGAAPDACRYAAGPVEAGEMHCLLIEREALLAVGGFDERVAPTYDHVDLSLSLRAAGYAIHLEPAARAVYLPPPPLTVGDIGHFRFQWSAARHEAGIARLEQKWDVACDYPAARIVERRIRLAADGLVLWAGAPLRPLLPLRVRRGISRVLRGMLQPVTVLARRLSELRRT